MSRLHFFDFARRSRFVRAVGALLGGAALAQIINLLFVPVLTRIYTPADFDVLAVFAAVSIIVNRGACLCFDFAIPTARDDREAANLLAVAGLSLLLCTAVVALVTQLVFYALEMGGWSDPRYDIFRWLLPLTTLLVGAATALDFWSTRARRFKILGSARVGQVIIGNLCQVVLGPAGWGTNGLLLGYTLLYSANLIVLGMVTLRRDGAALGQISGPGMAEAAKRFSKFPKFTAAEVTANAASVYLPLIIISAMIGGVNAGYLFLAIRLTQGPLLMLTAAVSQVYYSRASESMNADRLGSDTATLLRSLVALTAAPLLAACIVAPALCRIVLGPQWAEVGIYIGLLAPAFFLHFLSASVITTMHAQGKNAHLFYLTIGGLLLRAGAVWIAAVYFIDAVEETYAFTGAVFYGLSLWIFMRASDVKAREIVPRSKLIYAFSALLICLAVVAAFILHLS